jgi:imidazolonepropionase
MNAVVFQNARVLTLGAGRQRGSEMRNLGAIDLADVLVVDGRVATVGQRVEVPEGARVIACDGRVVMPSFVDCHTHLCWAGERLGEWERRLGGATYLELLDAGGGIMATVRAVRAATELQLAESLGNRLEAALHEGTTAIEIKSGYGLETESELKMLRAIASASRHWPGTVAMTACIGHALDPDMPDMVRRTIDETLPAVHAEFPGVTLDAYCETGAWSLEDCLELFDRAMTLGHPCRVHADQFNALGMVPAAIERGFVSVDHLEASTPDDLRLLARSQTMGVMLPCSGFHVDGRYGDGRAFVDAGGALAIATNCNPGSAPCLSMPMAMALAVRGCALTPAEAICAATTNGAALLGLENRGCIKPGAQADLIMLRFRDERELAHSFGGRAVDVVMVGGELVVGG